MNELKLYAEWTDDCQGKKDYDGPIISVSTRYWPGPGSGGFMEVNNEAGNVTSKTVPYGQKPSATSSIIIRHGKKEPGDGGGDYQDLISKDFEGDAEADVKSQVEQWAQEQMNKVVEVLTKAFNLTPTGKGLTG